MLRAVFFWSPQIEFFKSANGDCLTFRYGTFVYKCWNIHFLFRRDRPFKSFLAIHNEMKVRGLGEYMPDFILADTYVKYRYLPHTRDLVQAIIDEVSVVGRLDLLIRAFSLVVQMHNAGIVHGDLKPKNVLVTNEGRLYLIDFEDVQVTHEAQDRVSDYRKFIPRLMYLFTAAEVREVLARVHAPQELVSYMQPFLTAFSVRDIVKEIPSVEFEHIADVPGEDVDIYVPNLQHLSLVVQAINHTHLDHRIFFHSRDNVKVYVYSLFDLQILDVHLAVPVSRTRLRIEKTMRHAPVQIAVTGPDGVGKTTLLSNIERVCEDDVLNIFPKRFIHAWRFAREGWIPPVGHWSIRERISAKWRESLPGLRFAYERLLRRNTAPLILLDRSFYDPFLQRADSAFWLWPLLKWLFPPKVQTILLTATPATVIERKGELTAAAVEMYYLHAQKRLPCVAKISTEGSLEETQIHLERVIKYFLLTHVHYLPH